MGFPGQKVRAACKVGFGFRIWPKSAPWLWFRLDLWKANQPTSSSPMFVASTNWTPVSVITHLSYRKNVSDTQACRSDLVLTFLCSLSKIRSFSGVTHSHCGHTAEREGLAISAQIKTSLKVAALLVPESPPPPGWARAVTDFIQLVFSLAQPCS